VTPIPLIIWEILLFTFSYVGYSFPSNNRVLAWKLERNIHCVQKVEKISPAQIKQFYNGWGFFR